MTHANTMLEETKVSRQLVYRLKIPAFVLV